MAGRRTFLQIFAILCAIALAKDLPVVDLGYQKHQAKSYNATGKYYTFSNIRYAAPPMGELRFRAPRKPGKVKGITDGGKNKKCPQASPSWEPFAQPWIENYLFSKPLNISKKELHQLNETKKATPPTDPTQTEDCLFLDVAVPRHILTSAQSAKGKRKGGYPVFVWIYGGGYVAGSKSDYNPAGLIYRAMQGGREGMIYVALNYRLGAFGWLAGPTYQQDGTANAALHDQRFALEWVQKHIHLFGGDPNQVTVAGESAGGGSIMHQITAFGGMKGRSPFQQAIAQSPGWSPQTLNYQLDTQYHRFLELAGAKNLAELRKMPSEKLIKASYLQTFQAQYGEFVFGPAVDGHFVPALPGKLLLQGNFDKDLKVMVGHNGNEGLDFTNPFVKTQKQYRDYLRQYYPAISKSMIDLISDKLYPPVAQKKGPANYTYFDPIGRTAFTISEAIFTCNTNYLDRAFKDKTYAYLFDLGPALHGEDVAYTFYNNDGVNLANLLLNTTTAIAMQDFITTFVQNGKPSLPGLKGLPKFKMYGSDSDIYFLEGDNITNAVDPTMNRRCEFWQKVHYS